MALHLVQEALSVVVLVCVVNCVNGQTSLSDEDKQTLLDTHNQLRRAVNPTASNILTMVWSEELAQVAQNYATQCRFDHNTERTTSQATFIYVGENLFLTTGSANYAGFVQSWYNENQFYNYETNTCQRSKVCGHYTQVVWATSNNLGCGAYRCSTVSSSTFTDALLVVCNYGPGGNIGDQKPYESAACVRCAPEPKMLIFVAIILALVLTLNNQSRF